MSIQPPWGGLILIAVGVLCIAAAAGEILSGFRYGKFYGLYRSFEFRIDRSREPATFWSHILFWVIVGIALPVLLIAYGTTQLSR